jgi:putative transposase
VFPAETGDTPKLGTARMFPSEVSLLPATTIAMSRMARAVLVGVAHHLTQRGLDRKQVFTNETDYEVYLDLIRSNSKLFGTELLGYCLMPNHVHWVVAPQKAESLSRTFGEAHGRYAAYANAKLTRCGHFWQNRFYSCPLDQAHLWAAMRYVERNPVRARMVDQASVFRWSSAAAHAGFISRPNWLDAEPMQSTYTPEEWEVYLKSDNMLEAEVELRKNTYTGRPTGSREFVDWAESSLGRKLAAKPGGRPPKSSAACAATGYAQGKFYWGE